MLPKTAIVTFSLFLGIAALIHASAIRYVVTDLAPGKGATALAINSNGHVAGYYAPSGSETNGTHGFLYQDGAVTDIPPFAGGLQCRANGINDSDIVVGYAENSTFTKAFTFISGAMVQRGSLGGNNSYAYAINNSNVITGYSQIAGNNASHAFLYAYSPGNPSISNTDDAGTLGGTNSNAFAINNAGTAVGLSGLTGDQTNHATSFFVGGRVDLGTLPNGTSSIAYGINDLSVVVGSSSISGNTGLHAFSYDANANLTDLGLLPGTDYSQANGINANGEIVGYCTVLLGGARRAFIYTNGIMKDLTAMIEPGTDKIIWEANAINNSGQIAGRAINTGLTESYAVLLTPRTVANPTVNTAVKVKAKKSTVTLTGSATSEVSSITWQFGRKTGTASGTNAWQIRTPKLKPGKNVFTIIAHGYGGDSAPVRVTVKLAKKKA